MSCSRLLFELYFVQLDHSLSTLFLFFLTVVPQKAGDSPQHATRGATAASNSSSTSQGEAGRRVAMLRRSLREISQPALQQRVQQQQQQQRANLNLDHLELGEVSDSFERRMLADMKAENEEEDDEADGSGGNKSNRLPSLPPLRNPHPTKVARSVRQVSSRAGDPLWRFPA